MAAAYTISLNELLLSTIHFTRENEDMSAEEIIEQVLAKNLNVSVSTIRTETSETKTTTKKPRTQTAKPRSIPDDTIRCNARSFYEDQHIEGGKLKVMRDDPNNLYADRCKFKKIDGADFCKHHEEKQALGVWDAEYSGKLKTAVDKTENSTESTKPIVAKEPKQSKPKKEKAADTEKVKTPKIEPKVETSDEEDEEEETPETKVATPNQPKPKQPMPKIEDEEEEEEDDEEAKEAEEIMIDGVEYLIDEDGVVYDANTEEAVGVYNREKKDWIMRH